MSSWNCSTGLSSVQLQQYLALAINCLLSPLVSVKDKTRVSLLPARCAESLTLICTFFQGTLHIVELSSLFMLFGNQKERVQLPSRSRCLQGRPGYASAGDLWISISEALKTEYVWHSINTKYVSVSGFWP